MNYPLMMDYYELTMAQALFRQQRHLARATFDCFFRRIPEGGGYAVFAGLEQILNYVENLHFDHNALNFLRAQAHFDNDFLDYLRDFRFEGDIAAVPEGSVVFPAEPLIRVQAPLLACLLIETSLLQSVNHQSLIATKAARIVQAAAGRPVIEFGARRAHGESAALLGARAAYIGGVEATATTQAGISCGIPLTGTMAHAFVQSFNSEYEAFLAYAQSWPEQTVLLVDTYSVLKSGVPNAIRLYREFLAPQGLCLKGIRIDSGDLAYLSSRARQMLDEAGLQDAKIIVSNALDEHVIANLMAQDSAIDAFGVGERLIVASSDPVFGAVYKIVALEEHGAQLPKIKLSENVVKTTTPGIKQVWRLYDERDMALADVVTLAEETLNAGQPYLLFDPEYTWKQKTVTPARVEARLKPVLRQGKKCSPLPELPAIRARRAQELAELWPEVKRLENPHGYYVDFSRPLWELKQQLIDTYTR